MKSLLWRIILLWCVTTIAYASGVRDVFDVIRSSQTHPSAPSGVIRFYRNDNIAANPSLVIGWDNLSGVKQDRPDQSWSTAYNDNGGTISSGYTIYGVRFNVEARVGVGLTHLGGTVSGIMDGGWDEVNNRNTPGQVSITYPFSSADQANLPNIPQQYNRLSSAFASSQINNYNIVADAVNFGQLYSVYSYALRNIYQFDNSGKRGNNKLTFGNGSLSTVYLQGLYDNIDRLVKHLSIKSESGNIIIDGSGSTITAEPGSINVKSDEINNNAIVKVDNRVGQNLVRVNNQGVTIAANLDAYDEFGDFASYLTFDNESDISMGVPEGREIMKYTHNTKQLHFGGTPDQLNTPHLNVQYEDVITTAQFMRLYGGHRLYLDANDGIDATRKRIYNVYKAPLTEQGILQYGYGALNAEQIPNIYSTAPEITVTRFIKNDVPNYVINYSPGPPVPQPSPPGGSIEIGPKVVAIVDVVAGDMKAASKGWKRFFDGVANASTLRTSGRGNDKVVTVWKLFNQGYHTTTRLRLLSCSANNNYIKSIMPAAILRAGNFIDGQNGSVQGTQGTYYRGVVVVPQDDYNFEDFIVQLQAQGEDNNIRNAMVQALAGYDRSVPYLDEDGGSSWASAIYGLMGYGILNGSIKYLDNITSASEDPAKNHDVMYAACADNYNFSADDIRPLVFPPIVSNKFEGRRNVGVANFINSFYYDGQATTPTPAPKNSLVILPCKEAAADKTIRLTFLVYYSPRPSIVLPPPTLTEFILHEGRAKSRSKYITFNFSSTGEQPSNYMISESPTFAGATWQSVPPMLGGFEFTLSSGNGVKTVYFKVKDNKNRESNTMFDSIELEELNQSYADLTATPLTGSFPLAVTFFADAGGKFRIENYIWLTNNHAFATTTVNKITHMFMSMGVYSVSVRTQNISNEYYTSNPININVLDRQRLNPPTGFSAQKTRSKITVSWDDIADRTIQIIVVRFENEADANNARPADGILYGTAGSSTPITLSAPLNGGTLIWRSSSSKRNNNRIVDDVPRAQRYYYKAWVFRENEKVYSLPAEATASTQ